MCEWICVSKWEGSGYIDGGSVCVCECVDGGGDGVSVYGYVLSRV